MKKTGFAGLLFAVTLPLIGCIPAKEFRRVPQLTPLIVDSKPDATAPDSIAKESMPALRVGTSCISDGKPMHLAPAKNDGHDAGPCIAYVEYKEHGEHYKDHQIENAEALIREAIADDPSHQPVIVGFVHGWKHNASPGDGMPGAVGMSPPEDSNIQGLEHILNFLYHCYYLAPGVSNPCLKDRMGPLAEHADPSQKIEGHVVVGIYFSWHGANISPFWPVAQQLTVYTRGNDADNVGGMNCVDPNSEDLKESRISKDLEDISGIVHQEPIAKNEPLFVLVGHSYGARLLEQAICIPMQRRIDRQIAEPGKVPNFADLVLFVNSAAPAMNGITMLNYLSTKRVVYKKEAGDKSDQPLMAAITTPADAATGVIFSIAMFPKSQVHTGSTRIDIYDPASHQVVKPPALEDSSKLIRNTLGHMPEFQSHSFTDLGSRPEDKCGDVEKNEFDYWVPGHCFHVKPAEALSGQTYRWNATPYWIISTDQTVIPDHGTIFTNRLLRLIGHFLPDETAMATVRQDAAIAP